MVNAQKPQQVGKLDEVQKKEGYWIEQSGDYMLVWHNNNQIALLRCTPDIDQKIQDVVDRKRKELKEVEEKTGWKPK